MSKRKKILILCCALAAFFVITAAASLPKPTPDTARNNSIGSDAQRLAAVLKGGGFEVLQGYFRLYTADDCIYSYESMHSCYGNNPAAPYVSFALPRWPEEYIDPVTQTAFGLLKPGYESVFRLDPGEALVVFGRLPPPAAYFGLQMYVFSHEGSIDTTSPTYQYLAAHFPAMMDEFFITVPGNPKRVQLFASLGNSNNNVVIENQSGAAFDQNRFFIITADQLTEKKVRKALQKIAGGDQNIFTEPIPSTVKTGLDEHADDFVPIIRYAMPADGGGPGTPSDTWKKDLPLVVLRVRDPHRAVAPQPYGPISLDARTAEDESWLQADLNQLAAAVNSRWGQPCTKSDCSDRGTLNFIDLQSPPLNLVGPLCVPIGMNCLADTQDTVYQASIKLDLDHGEVYAVAGTLGTKTGNATYVGLSVNESLMLKGVANISSDQLDGSAQAYAATVNNTGYLFLYYLTRDCSTIQNMTDGKCLSITSDMVPICTEDAENCDSMKLALREYIHPGTQRAPDSTQVLPAKLIQIKKP